MTYQAVTGEKRQGPEVFLLKIGGVSNKYEAYDLSNSEWTKLSKKKSKAIHFFAVPCGYGCGYVVFCCAIFCFCFELAST